MKIGSSLPPVADTAVRATSQGAGAAAGVAGVAGAAAARDVDKVDLSVAGARIGEMDGAADFDSAKVDAIRQAIREGRFSVNAGAIADKLIADAASLLSPRTPSA